MSLVSGLECGPQKADRAERHGIRPIDDQQHLLIGCSWGLVMVKSDGPNERKREKKKVGQRERRRQGRRQEGEGSREQWSCCWGSPACQASVKPSFVSCDPPLCSSGQVTLCLASWSGLLCFANKRPRPRPILAYQLREQEERAGGTSQRPHGDGEAPWSPWGWQWLSNCASGCCKGSGEDPGSRPIFSPEEV